MTKRHLIAVAVFGALIGLWISPGRGYAATPHIETNAHGVVTYSNLPSCKYEDGSGGRRPCSWNVNEGDGNGIGLAYWVSKSGHTNYVWAHSPMIDRPHFRWVHSDEADALAESGYPHATTRHWERCIIRHGDGRAVVRCPNGDRITWS